MKKKNLIMTLAVVATMGMVITGCGDKPEKVTVEVQPTEVVEQTEETVETETETEVEEPATEEAVTEEATDTVEAEVEVPELDILAQNGFVVTPQGEMVMPMGIQVDADTVLEETQDINVDITVETTPAEEGYVNTTFKAHVTSSSQAFKFQLEPFDRYTGYFLHMEDVNMSGKGGSAEEDYVLELDGKTYNCKYSADWVKFEDGNGKYYEATVTIHHPEEYDGVVFKMGKLTGSQKLISKAIDWTKPVNLMDNPELLEGQYYFTATNN